MRAVWYKFLSLFGYQPKLSTETGFVLPGQKDLFWRALWKYFVWMVCTCVASFASEFAAYIVATFFFFYNGTGLFSYLVNLFGYCLILAVPVLVILAVHIWLYKRIRADDSRFSMGHFFLFLAISLAGAFLSLYFGWALIFA